MLHSFREFLTEIAIRWNSGQKMGLFMLLMAAEISNFIAWMLYIEFSEFAQDFVNLTIVNHMFPWAIGSYFFILSFAYLFFKHQDNEPLIEKLELFIMTVYSIGAAYVGYIVGYDNLISGISISAGCILIILLCRTKFAFGLVALNVALMFGLMFATNSGLITPSALHVGELHSTFWVASYVQLCAVKLIFVLFLILNILLVLKRSYKDTKYISEHDGLTGLPNRNKVLKYLEKNLTRTKPVGLVMIDLDYFKQINDNFGHSKGDEVLIKVGNMLKQSLREYDMLGRYGGEEFILVIPDANLEIATIVSSRLHQMVKQLEIPLGDNKILKPTASFGVVSTDFIKENFGDDITEIEMQKHLFEVADASMYYAKAHGRNLLVTALDIPPESLSTKNQDKGEKKMNLTIIEG